ncbi:MAG: DUF3147 family protein [Hyphomicrobiales bacterium]|nr:DUF3147 family protein [Hyphomicrobiales bacterium]
MGYLALKALLSGAIIMVVSEVSKRSPSLGALIVSLPLTSILAMIWMWRDGVNDARIATHAAATFWYVLPSLPMFLVMPWLMRAGHGFWLALAAGCAITAALYLAMIFLLARFDIIL